MFRTLAANLLTLAVPFAVHAQCGTEGVPHVYGLSLPVADGEPHRSVYVRTAADTLLVPDVPGKAEMLERIRRCHPDGFAGFGSGITFDVVVELAEREVTPEPEPEPQPPPDMRANLWVFISTAARDLDAFRVQADPAFDVDGYGLDLRVVGRETYEFTNDMALYSDDGPVDLADMNISVNPQRLSTVRQVRAEVRRGFETRSLRCEIVARQSTRLIVACDFR